MYTTNATASYGGHNWSAKWWTQGEQPGTDEKRLGDRGVLDGVLVGRRAVGDEVDLGGVGQCGQLVTQAGQLEPRGEEARGLGALAGADDDDHVPHPVLPTVTFS